MKKIKLFSILAAFVAAVSFTSCNTGDGDSYQAPSLEQQQTMISNLGYMQDGILVYYNENKLNTKDITDTIPNTIAYMTSDASKDKNGTIQSYYGVATFQFPVSILKKYISDDKLAEKIGEMAPQSMKVYLLPYSAANMTFVANPDDLKLGDITTDKQTYKDVTIKFYNNYYSAGFATSQTTKKSFFLINMVAGAIYVNGNQTSLLKSSSINSTQYPPYFWFTTEK